MNKRIVSFLTVLVLTLAIGIEGLAVKDIDQHWAEPHIRYLMKNEIMSGYSDGTFRPDDKISRAEFLKIANNVYENEDLGTIDFKDIAKDDWFYEDIAKAVEAGYLEGYTDKTIRPNDPIDRQEVSKIIVRASGLEDFKVKKPLDFKDRGKIDSWALPYVDIMVEKGYMSGYTDHKFRPKNQLTRAEASKILANVKEEIEIDKQIQKEKEEKEKEKEDQQQLPGANPVYSVQVGSFKTEEGAMKLGSQLLSEGHGDSFIARDNYNIYYVIAKDFKLRADANRYSNELNKKGYKSIVSRKDFKSYELIEIKEDLANDGKDKDKDKDKNQPEARPPVEEKPPVDETALRKFQQFMGGMPEASTIDRLTEKLLIDIETANNMYNKLGAGEKKQAGKELDKLRSIEKKANSLKTDIVSSSKTSVEKAQEWARSRGAHERFIDIAPEYWKYGEMTGINPEILYAQAAKETNFGKYTGSVRPEMNNWAGIKTNNPSGDATYDHEIFETPEDGVRAQFNHMGIYVGKEPIGEPHPRWYVTSKVAWKGTVQKVEDLGGKWAPSRDYGISIMRDYVNQIYSY